MTKLQFVLAGFAAGLIVQTAVADTVSVGVPRIEEGRSWTVLQLTEAEALVSFAEFDESSTFWDLRPSSAFGRHVRWSVRFPSDVGLESAAREVEADLALCADEVEDGRRIGCSLFHSLQNLATGRGVSWTDLPDQARRIDSTLAATQSIEVGTVYAESWRRAGGVVERLHGRAVAEGVALVPAGPHEVVLLREEIRAADGVRLRYRFLTKTGETVATLAGPLPPSGSAFRPDEGALRAAPAADDGIEIPYEKLSAALVPGATGFLQYSQEATTALSTIHPDWTGVAEMISIDTTNVPYQPDPTDPATLLTLPEVWDFSGLETSALDYRTFNTIRDELGGSACAESCASYDPGPNPADGTWQAYLKIDKFAPGGAFSTRDIFELNDNDTGANPSIDVPYVGQNELNVDGSRIQICFEQSAGGADRLLRFFQFAGPDPASAVMGAGDTWASGNWTECDNGHGLRLTATVLCADDCYPACGAVNPRARGLFAGGAGLISTIVEDGWVKLATGNYVQALLMRQDTDVEAGIDLFGICNVSTTRLRTFDYFWLHEDYGLLALVSSPSNVNILADDWSAIGNVTDGVDFSWGPFPPYQFSARACLAGTKVEWALPADGSNLTGNPGVSDYGYVVSWGASSDPEELADWITNPNHTALPGDAGYLAAPPAGEPTSSVITGWGGSSIHATVVTALRYTDPDLGDTQTYASPAFYKAAADPAVLDAGSFAVGNAVAPFVGKSGADLTLSWPAVAGAGSYSLQVYDLDAGIPVACPAELDCSPELPTATHTGAATDGSNYGYRVVAVDPCGAPSAN